MNQVIVIQNGANPYQNYHQQPNMSQHYNNYQYDLIDQNQIQDQLNFGEQNQDLQMDCIVEGNNQINHYSQDEVNLSLRNIHSLNFCSILNEGQNQRENHSKSEKGIYNIARDESSKCQYSEYKVMKKLKKEEIDQDINSPLKQGKTNRELLEEKEVFKGQKVNSGEASYQSYNDGVGVNNKKLSIAQYCQARYIDDQNQRKRQKQNGNISDLIRMNEFNQNLWGFQRLDEDKKYDWVIEDIFIQNNLSANISGGRSQILGKGAFGNVIKVKDNNTQIQYALKFIKKSFFTKAITETEIMKQFKDEKNIIQYYDIYLYDQQTERNEVIEIQQYLVIVMELAQGSLDDILKQRMACQTHWSTVELITIMKHIANAVSTLTSKNIAHRDIKPSNILYSLDQQSYKLADFGEAKLVLDHNFNTPHTPRGTKRYMSPELLNGLNAYNNSTSQNIIQPSSHPLREGNQINLLEKEEQKYVEYVEKIEINQKRSLLDLPFSEQFNPLIQHLSEGKMDLEECHQSMQKSLRKELDNLPRKDISGEKEQKIIEIHKDSDQIKQKKPSLSIKINNNRNVMNQSKEVIYEPYSNDIYSLGICFFQMKYLDDLSQYNGHEQKTPQIEQYLTSKLVESDPIDAFILKMIDFDPKKRPNIKEVLNFIELEHQRITKQMDNEGIHFNYEISSSSSHTIDQINNISQSLNQINKLPIQNIPYYQQTDNMVESQSEIFQDRIVYNQNIIKHHKNSNELRKRSSSNKQSLENNKKLRSYSQNQINEESSHSSLKQNNNNVLKTRSSQILQKQQSNQSKNNSIPLQNKQNSQIIITSPPPAEICSYKKISENYSDCKIKSFSIKENEKIESIQNDQCNKIFVNSNQNNKISTNDKNNSKELKKSSQNLSDNKNENISSAEISASQKVIKKEFRPSSISQMNHNIFISNNDTYDNLKSAKILVGSSRNHRVPSFIYSESIDSDYEEDESSDNDSNDNSQDSEMQDDEEQEIHETEVSEKNKIQQNPSLKKQNSSLKNKKSQNIPENLLEEFKEDAGLHNNKRIECMDDKVNEHHFLKLIETKRQSNLTITQKIQYIIARAQAYESLLKFQKARDTFQELYEKHFQCLSPLDQINLLKNLGRLEHKMSKFDSSIMFYQQLLELLKQSKELNDLQISEVYQMLGSAHCFQGDYQAALKYYADSLQKKELLKDSVEVEEIADLLVYIGLVKKHLQQYQSSLENYEKALEIVNQNPEKNLKRISCIKKNIGSVYDHMQNNSQSVQYLEGALQDMIQAYGTENERVVNCLNKLGMVLVHSGQHNHESAIQYFEKAMKIIKKLYKMDTINESHRKQFRFKDFPLDETFQPLYNRALTVNEEAYIIYRQVYDYYHVSVGIILEIRGMIYHYLNNFQLALKYYDEALNIYTVILKPEHEFVKRCNAFISISKATQSFQNFPKL